MPNSEINNEAFTVGRPAVERGAKGNIHNTTSLQAPSLATVVSDESLLISICVGTVERRFNGLCWASTGGVSRIEC